VAGHSAALRQSWQLIDDVFGGQPPIILGDMKREIAKVSHHRAGGSWDAILM
jgi:hypothetical protein